MCECLCHLPRDRRHLTFTLIKVGVCKVSTPSKLQILFTTVVITANLDISVYNSSRRIIYFDIQSDLRRPYNRIFPTCSGF